jgi:hypothetical protein
MNLEVRTSSQQQSTAALKESKDGQEEEGRWIKEELKE